MDEDRLHRQPYDQLQGGDGRREACLPGRAPAPAVPGAGGRLLRVAKDRGRQEADANRHEVGEPFAFAGVWSTWKDPEAHAVPSSAIITSAANTCSRPSTPGYRWCCPGRWKGCGWTPARLPAS